MDIYEKNGYVNISAILAQHQPFTFVWGGRATGKTYGALKYVLENQIKFILMRRTQTQLDIISKPEFSPFKSINNDLGCCVGIAPLSKYNGGIYEMEELDGRLVPKGAAIGYTCALSTVTNIRGFDASDVELVIYDEFIPEKHSRPIKGEAEAFLNAYETINRNRELQGRQPLQVLCLANANSLANPIFMGLNLVTKAEQMQRNGQELSIIGKRGVCLVNLCNSRISTAKRETALYRLSGDSEFSAMALSNEFSNDEYVGVCGSKPLKEFRPIVTIGEITVYAHKAEQTWHISTHKQGSPPEFGMSDGEKARFRKSYMWLWREYYAGRVTFENRMCEILLTNIYK